MFKSPNPRSMRAGISVRNRQTSEGWHGSVSGCMDRFPPGLDWSEYAAASPPMLNVGIFSRSDLHLLLPSVVGRSLLLIIRSPFNVDAELKAMKVILKFQSGFFNS